MARVAVKASLSRRNALVLRARWEERDGNRRLWRAIALAVVIGGRGAQAQTPIPPSPKDFVMAASQSDQYEILAASVASVQGQDPRVRTFAQEMIQDHTRLFEELSKAATAAGLPPPERGMSSDQATLLSSLQSLRGGSVANLAGGGIPGIWTPVGLGRGGANGSGRRLQGAAIHR
jgi:hypothetical protein